MKILLIRHYFALALEDNWSLVINKLKLGGGELTMCLYLYMLVDDYFLISVLSIIECLQKLFKWELLFYLKLF